MPTVLTYGLCPPIRWLRIEGNRMDTVRIFARTDFRSDFARHKANLAPKPSRVRSLGIGFVGQVRLRPTNIQPRLERSLSLPVGRAAVGRGSARAAARDERRGRLLEFGVQCFHAVTPIRRDVDTIPKGFRRKLPYTFHCAALSGLALDLRKSKDSHC